MSNGTEDIGVRIVVDYAKALKDVQAFTGTVGKEFNGLPKIVQQVSTSIDTLTARVNKLGAANGAEELHRDMAKLPPVVEKLTTSIDQLSNNIDKMGRNGGRGLRNINEEATRLSRTFDKLVTGGKAIGAAVVGFQAGKMVFQPHMERMLDYDTKLAHMANVGYAGKSVAERIAGKADLDKVILGSTRAGGGTRDEAIDTLQKLLGSGVVSDQDAKTMLPAIMKAATASGSSPDQIADIGIRSMQNMGFEASDLPRVIDMAIKSGNVGGFELKDMAKWLPAQMAEAATLGMKGDKGFAQLLALNQASITTAGSTDSAGINVSNLLNKINSRDTQLDFKNQGIDLTGSLQNAIGKGVDPITAFSMLVDRVMSKDKNYLAMEKKRQSSTSSAEQAEILEKQLQLAEGTAIGKVLQDRQARGAFLGFKKQGATYRNQVDDVLANSAGTTDSNFAVMSESPGFKRQQSLNDSLNAQNEVMQKLVPTLNSYWDVTSSLAREYPLLNAAVEGGKITVTTLGAAAGSASIVMALLTRNAAAASAALGGVAITGGGKALTGGAYGAGMGKFGKALNITGAGAAGWEVGSLINDYAINPLANKIGGNKGDSLGTLLYDLLNPEKKADPIAKITGTDMTGFRTGGPNQDAVSSALKDSIKSNPIQAQLQLKVAFDEMGKPFVTQTNMTGTNFRLDTGPTMRQ